MSQKRDSWQLTLWFIVAALVLGTLADSFARTLVEMPAWRSLGATAWAAFSRLADLGAGRVIYLVAGIGTTVLILAAAILFRMSSVRPWSVAGPVYGAALMHIGVLALTTQAAPIMLSLPRLGNDPVALQQAFDGFARWDGVRAGFDALASCAQIWTIVALLMHYRGRQPAPTQ